MIPYRLAPVLTVPKRVIPTKKVWDYIGNQKPPYNGELRGVEVDAVGIEATFSQHIPTGCEFYFDDHTQMRLGVCLSKLVPGQRVRAWVSATHEVITPYVKSSGQALYWCFGVEPLDGGSEMGQGQYHAWFSRLPPTVWDRLSV